MNHALYVSTGIIAISKITSFHFCKDKNAMFCHILFKLSGNSLGHQEPYFYFKSFDLAFKVAHQIQNSCSATHRFDSWKVSTWATATFTKKIKKPFTISPAATLQKITWQLWGYAKRRKQPEKLLFGGWGGWVTEFVWIYFSPVGKTSWKKKMWKWGVTSCEGCSWDPLSARQRER